jgi:RNA polymerase sigma-70 factor (ECF subfamily)
MARLWHAAASFEIGHRDGITGRLEDSGWSVAGVQDESVMVLPELPDRVNRHRLEPASLAQHRPRLLRAAVAMSGSPEDAEDLVQETFERVLRRPRFVQRDRDMAYLMRALRHICAAQARSADRRRTTPSPPEELEWITDGRGEPEAAMDAQIAYEAIAGLSEPLRATIVAVDVVGLSYKEAARSLRTRVGTIMSRLYRAREQVAAALEAP